MVTAGEELEHAFDEAFLYVAVRLETDEPRSSLGQSNQRSSECLTFARRDPLTAHTSLGVLS